MRKYFHNPDQHLCLMFKHVIKSVWLILLVYTVNALGKRKINRNPAKNTKFHKYQVVIKHFTARENHEFGENKIKRSFRFP